MSRRRRAALLLGLALALGGLAASDVAQREAALARRLGPLVPVLVTREKLADGARLEAPRLALRRMPARFVPPGALAAPERVLGRRVRGPLPAGSPLTAALVRAPAGAGAGLLARPGERVAELVATGDPALLGSGTRVDVLVTREGTGEAPGRTELALQDVEVLEARRAPAAEDAAASAGTPRVAAALRVGLREAVFLAAAQSFAREIRLLPRAPGDRGRAAGGLAQGEDLRP